ncbi:uncharacterized protein BJ212DRAFT_101209 [Suillus subaureus]|uniref:Uncharacterized protein n=1 Tax=Suillus subaureus TaxID=48587 RepID=A0A9P7EDL8_9AGAM|nr:uncharacterized protein BJ212DRAFT_101209 [Suillus subaureus]KAG1818645.1 hypothetical protein BJ212DRAFT_101209 [Suillus subaureus]
MNHRGRRSVCSQLRLTYIAISFLLVILTQPILARLSMKVAVIGSRVSSLVAAWALNEHNPHEVEDRAGRHANTIRYIHLGISDGDAVDVDTGFVRAGHFTFTFLHLAPYD